MATWPDVSGDTKPTKDGFKVKLTTTLIVGPVNRNLEASAEAASAAAAKAKARRLLKAKVQVAKNRIAADLKKKRRKGK